MALPKPSNAILKECKKHKLKTPMHKAFCDLVLAGWEKEDAYAFSGLWNSTYSTLMNIQDMNHLLKEDIGVVSYIDTRVKEQEALKKKAKKAAEQAEKLSSPDITEEDMANALSKETQLKELLVAKNTYTVGSKEWLDVKKMIADLTRIKQDDIQDDDDVVHFYVPIQCHSCSLYMAQKAKHDKSNSNK